jgi:hypothetical protein
MKIINGFEKRIEIDNLDKWFELCPPRKGEEHWKDYRSAKEMAKFWLNAENREDFQNFIRKAIPDFTFEYIIPEFESEFDQFPSPRRHDLYIEEKENKAVVAIEGKADEPFNNKLFGEQFIETIKTKMENGKSVALDRMVNFYTNFFYLKSDILNIMYQLSYWYAGALIDAVKADTNNFIMVLQEFRSGQTDTEKLNKNHKDFENFIEYISEGKYKTITNRQIIGPILNMFTNQKNLFIGYYSTDL